ncbi:MAG: hypothetical protein R3F61_33585 [Myxococcota bacterium]
MRNLMSVLAIAGAVLVTTACSGGKDEDTSTPTDPCEAAGAALDSEQCLCEIKTSVSACCAAFPDNAECAVPCDTAPELSDYAYIAFQGDANYLAGTYTGTESFGYYRFNNQDAPALGDETALCEFTYTAANAANPQATPCAECEWDVRVAFTNGVETSDTHSFTDPESGALYSCALFNTTVDADTDYGYGFGQYTYMGTDYPALYFFNDDDSTWGPATLEASYDAVSGDFTYNWILQAGYLGAVVPPCE